MGEQTEAQKRYNTPVEKIGQESGMNKTADKVPAHEGEQKVTRSTEGSVETTTEKK